MHKSFKISKTHWCGFINGLTKYTSNFIMEDLLDY